MAPKKKQETTNLPLKEKTKKGQRQSELDAVGIDAICAMIGDLKSLTEIARALGVSIGTLQTWIDKDPERSARAREVRAATAKHWDEKAEQGIEAATDPFSLSRAKELAHHYRWRASKIAPKEYGDKLDLNHGGKLELIDQRQRDAAVAAAISCQNGAEKV